jgi:small subunit ribosomal protein S20
MIVAHSLSAKKRIRQNAKHRVISRARKSQIKTQIKRFETAEEAGDLTKAEQEFVKAVKKLDRVASTSTMHKNTAARKKSQLARRLNALRAKAAAS